MWESGKSQNIWRVFSAKVSVLNVSSKKRLISRWKICYIIPWFLRHKNTDLCSATSTGTVPNLLNYIFIALNPLVCGFPEAGPRDRLQHIDSILKRTTRHRLSCLLNHSPKWLWTQFMDKECDRGIFGETDPKYTSSPSQWSVNQWRQSCNIINHRPCHKCIHPPSCAISGV